MKTKTFTPKPGTIWSVPFVVLMLLGLFDQYAAQEELQRVDEIRKK